MQIKSRLLRIIWEQEGCTCLPLANEYARYSFLLSFSGGSSFPYPLCIPLITYAQFVWITQWPGRLILSLWGSFSFPRNSLFCLKILPTWEKRNQPFPAVWNTGLQNIQKSAGDGFCAFAQNDIKIDFWSPDTHIAALVVQTQGGSWVGEMKRLFLPTDYREPRETLSVSFFRLLKCSEVNSTLGVMQNTLNGIAWPIHTGFCAGFLDGTGALWTPDLQPFCPPAATCSNFPGWFSFGFLKLKA